MTSFFRRGRSHNTAPLWLCLAPAIFIGTWTSHARQGPSISSSAEAPTVGMEGRLEVLLPESGLSAKMPDRRTPMLLRIALTRPHGTLTHYDLRYIGRVPGRYDLREYLITT